MEIFNHMLYILMATIVNAFEASEPKETIQFLRRLIDRLIIEVLLIPEIGDWTTTWKRLRTDLSLWVPFSTSPSSNFI